MDIVTPTALQAATAALFATRGLPTATRNAVLEDDDLQDEVISIINTAKSMEQTVEWDKERYRRVL